MAFDPIEALRAAGVLDALAGPEEFYRSLTPEETAVLISLKDRLPQYLPEVLAHSADWATPEKAGPNMQPTDCFCGAWSGSGSSSPIRN